MVTDDIATIREALDNLGNEGYSTVDGAAAFAALDRVEARLAEARAECNRCGGPFPEHAELCEYRTTAERAEQAERERERLQAILTTRTFSTTESGAELVAQAERERDEARAQADRLREAIGDALNSLHSGPMRDGYAYQRLEDAVAGPQNEEGEA